MDCLCVALGLMGFAVISIPATGTDNQALQQIASTTLSEHGLVAGFLAIVLQPHQRGLHRPGQAQECSSIVQEEHRDGSRRVWVARAAPVALAVEVEAARSLVLPKAALAFVRRIVEHAARWWHDPRPFCRFVSAPWRLPDDDEPLQWSSDLVRPIKDLADDACLFPARSQSWLLQPLLVRDIAIPIRSSTKHTHLSDLCSMPLATPTAL